MKYQCLSKISNNIGSNNLEKSNPNVSLLFDKYYPCLSENKLSSNRILLQEISRISGYTSSYVNKAKDRILKSLIIPLEKSIGRKNFFCIVGELKSNLALNLATRFYNSGISLDRRTGLPMIWGSAIKGCCAHAIIGNYPTSALNEDILNGNLYMDTFGGYVEVQSVSGEEKIQASKGKVNFFPAFMFKQKDKSNPIELDVITPHKGNKPIPIFFPIVKRGAKFIFIVALNEYGLYEMKDGKLSETSQEYRDRILNYAKSAMLEAFYLGIGAKSSSNFGWFQFDEDESNIFLNDLQKVKQIISEKEKYINRKLEFESIPLIEQYRKRLENAPTNGQGEDAALLSKEAKDLKNRMPDEQKVFIDVMCKSKKNTLKSWRKKGKPEYKFIREVAESLGINFE